MTGLVALLATLILLAAHWLARGRPPSSPAPALLMFVPAALAAWLLAHLGGWPAPMLFMWSRMDGKGQE